MVTVPEATPVTMPVAGPTVAVAVLLLAHVPPVVASASVVVDPAQTVAVPVIAAGATHRVICAHQVSQSFAVVALASCIVQKSVWFSGSITAPE